VGECAAFSRLLFGVSERIKIMIFFILYALGTFAFVCWILGWSLWHAYLAFSRFFKIHNHKRRTWNFMPRAILAQVNDSAAQAGVGGIIAKLRKAIRIEIPIGYQDETGFHKGVKPTETEVK
jgi:hypothetical protein